MAVSYGHVAIVPKGIWSAETQYEACNLVEHDGSSYVAKARPPVGTLPTDTSYWQVSAAGTKKASSGSLGTVMPDGRTTEVNEEGKLSAKTAQQDAVGVVKGSDDITVSEDGNLTVNTEFEQATELANLIAGEAIKSVLGKVSKAIAATMNLDQNALLKNMISGIDVNSGEKVPSSAFVHTLYERLGMGTDLSAGDAENVTQAVNALYSNLISSEMQTTQEASTTSVTLSKRGKTAMVSCVFTTLKDMSAASYDSVTVGYLPDELHPVKDVDIIFGRQGSNDLYYGRIRASGKIELWCWGGKEIPNGTNFSFSSVFLTA